MNRFQTIALFGILAAQVGVAGATGPGSLNEFPQRYLPVLVQVDAKGNVTNVSPSMQLSPVFDRLLRKNLDELITSPATNSKGRPISSQFVMNLALNVQPRTEGEYSANFTYLSSSPVPSGSWYWVHINGHRLALASQSNRFDQPRNYYHNWDNNRPDGRFYQRSPSPAFQNVQRSAAPSAPAPAPRAPAGRGP